MRDGKPIKHTQMHPLRQQFNTLTLCKPHLQEEWRTIKKISVYIHIPFCHHVCPYCAFVKDLASADKIRRFCVSLKKEIRYYAALFPNATISTLYFGGGTPNTLSSAQFERIMKTLSTEFKIAPQCEITIELNPTHTKKAFIRTLCKTGVNRVSLGVQSVHPSELDFLGRLHNHRHVRRTVDLLKQHGLTNINLDIIYGLPTSSVHTLAATVSACLMLDPAHISTYCLTIEPGTPFHRQKIRSSDPDEQAKQYNMIRNTLKKAGYSHYEISAFAKPKKAARHNMAYWRLTPFIGLGPGANGYVNGLAYAVTRNIQDYIQDPTPPLLKNTQKLTQPVQIQDFLMMGLRLKEGIRKSEFEKRFHQNIDSVLNMNALAKLSNHRLVHNTSQTLKITPKGFPIADEILSEILT